MNLYKISQTAVRGYDTYDEAVVAAECVWDAAMTHPRGAFAWEAEAKYDYGPTWARSPDDVKVEFIGTAAEGTKPGVIVASYLAG